MSGGGESVKRELTGCKIRSYFFDSLRHKATMPALPGAKGISEILPTARVLAAFFRGTS